MRCWICTRLQAVPTRKFIWCVAEVVPDYKLSQPESLFDALLNLYQITSCPNQKVYLMRCWICTRLQAVPTRKTEIFIANISNIICYLRKL